MPMGICTKTAYIANISAETGRKVSRVNPPEQWIVVDVPEFRIVDDELWQAVKDGQQALSEQYADVIAVVRAANTSPGTNRTG